MRSRTKSRGSALVTERYPSNQVLAQFICVDCTVVSLSRCWIVGDHLTRLLIGESLPTALQRLWIDAQFPDVVHVPDRVLEARPNVVLRRVEERIFVETHDVAFRRFGIRRSFDRSDLAEQTHPGQPDARGDLEDGEPGRGVGAAAGPLQSLLPRPEVQGNEARAFPDHGRTGPPGTGAGRRGVLRARGGDGVLAAALHRGARLSEI